MFFPQKESRIGKTAPAKGGKFLMMLLTKLKQEKQNLQKTVQFRTFTQCTHFYVHERFE